MIQVALIGYGYWGPNLLRNLFNTSGCKPVYCVDQDITKLKKLKKIYPSVITTNNVDEVLEDTELNAVVIATPTKTHFSLAKKALLSGKHVLIEKPMVITKREADELYKLSRKLRKVAMVDHTFLFNEAVVKVKKLIDKGAIGDVLYIDSVRVNLGLFQKDVNVIYDLASHDFSIIQYLLGKKPTSVFAQGSSHFGKQEDVAYIMAEYSKKVFAHVHVSWLSPAKVRRMLIIGTKKMVLYDDNEPAEKIKVYDKGVFFKHSSKDLEQMKIGYRSGDIRLPKIDLLEPLGQLTKEFVSSIEKKRTPKSDIKLGRDVVNILETATKSIRTGRKIKTS